MARNKRDWHDRGAYIPSPDDISKATARIREGWSKREHLRRLNGTYKGAPVELQELTESLLVANQPDY